MRGFWIAICFCFSMPLYAQVVNQIEYKGNKKTVNKILERELTFKLGDTITFSDTLSHRKNSENNLFNTSLFNFTKVSFTDSLGDWKALIEVQERWYLWPEVQVKFQERNFSEWWKNKDLSRIDIGLHLNKFNFLGRNQKVQVNAYYGFTESFGFEYKLPYLTKKQRDGFKVAAGYATQNEVFVGVDNNEMVYIKNDSVPIQSQLTLKLEYFRRSGFYKTHFFTGRYVSLEGKDTLSSISNHYFGTPNSKQAFVNLTYRFRIDKRFTQNYPLRGYFFDTQLDQFGLENLDNSKLSVVRLLSSYRFYKELGKRKYWASGVHLNHYFSNNTPFYLQSGLGFTNYIRGYEPYVLYGKTSFLLKNNFKLQLISPKSYTLPLIRRIKKFSKVHFAMYWNVYSDMGYVYNDLESSNDMLNQFLVGVGTGLDWVTYYDIVIRTEYSFNQFGDGNFNISFVAPI